MQVNNVDSALNQRVNPSAPLSPPADTSSSSAQAPESPQIDARHSPTAAAEGESLLFGSVGLDLFYSRSENLVRDYRTTGPNGYRQVHQEMSRRYEAGLSLDFSFLAKFEGAAEKLRNVDNGVFADWAKEASDLLSLSKSDFEEFVSATDELFNEIEKVLGMGPEGLDHVASFFGEQVQGFLSDVKDNKQYFDQNPLGEGEDGGLGIPALLEGAKNSIPQNFQNFAENLFNQEGEGPLGTADNTPMIGTLKEFLNQILANIRNAEKEMLSSFGNIAENRVDNSPEVPNESTGSAPEEELAKTSNESKRFMREVRISYHYQRQMSMSGIMEYQQTTPEKPAQPELSVAA